MNKMVDRRTRLVRSTKFYAG